MKIISIIIACISLVGCDRPIESTAPPTSVDMFRVSDAKLSIAMPEGWFKMPKESWYLEHGFSAAFQKGEDPAIPSSYILVQTKQQKKWPSSDLQPLIAKAFSLEKIQDLTNYISAGEHNSQPELYSAKHDAFIFVQEYEEQGKQSTTVMVKRFFEEHYVVLHFYLRDNLESDVDAIEFVMETTLFNEDQKTIEPPLSPSE